jgi:hypothetical protein
MLRKFALGVTPKCSWNCTNSDPQAAHATKQMNQSRPLVKLDMQMLEKLQKSENISTISPRFSQLCQKTAENLPAKQTFDKNFSSNISNND